MGIGRGVINDVCDGVRRYAYMGGGVHHVYLLIQWVFRLVRMAWHICVNLV